VHAGIYVGLPQDLDCPTFGKIVLRYIPDKRLPGAQILQDVSQRLSRSRDVSGKCGEPRAAKTWSKAAKPKVATVSRGVYAARGGLEHYRNRNPEPENVESTDLIEILREVRERVRSRQP
jgi:hypothetical protein